MPRGSRPSGSASGSISTQHAHWVARSNRDSGANKVWAVRGFVTETGATGKLRQFTVVDAQQSLAARQKFTDQIGLITAAFYSPKSGSRGVGTGLGKEGDENVAEAQKMLPGDLLGVVHIRYSDGWAPQAELLSVEFSRMRTTIPVAPARAVARIATSSNLWPAMKACLLLELIVSWLLFGHAAAAPIDVLQTLLTRYQKELDAEAFAASEQTARQMLSIADRSFSTNYTLQIKIVELLAASCNKQDKYTDAQPFYERAIKLHRRVRRG